MKKILASNCFFLKEKNNTFVYCERNDICLFINNLKIQYKEAMKAIKYYKQARTYSYNRLIKNSGILIKQSYNYITYALNGARNTANRISKELKKAKRFKNTSYVVCQKILDDINKKGLNLEQANLEFKKRLETFDKYFY